MKALLYKEFKLAMHPICYVFVCLFPLMILIPSYPLVIGFIYVLCSYPILFLGANKGQQSNDLLYSTLLPVRKKDIVKARIMTVAILQFAFMALMTCLLPVARVIQNAGASVGENFANPGLDLDGFVSVLAIGIVGFSLADLIFFPIYYKNGKSIVLSTLLTILVFALYLCFFALVLPYIPGLEGYKAFLCKNGLGIQFGLLAGSLVIYAGIHYLVYRISAKRLEKVDF